MSENQSIPPQSHDFDRPNRLCAELLARIAVTQSSHCASDTTDGKERRGNDASGVQECAGHEKPTSSRVALQMGTGEMKVLAHVQYRF